MLKPPSSTISCIVPVYNQAHFLPAALDSIFAQSLPVTEVIVVDDGSSDDVEGVVDKYAHDITFIQQANAGPAAARNRGIERSSGEWLSFIDSDDIWHEDKLKIQMQLMQSRPELDYCFTYKHNFWEQSMAEEESRLRAAGHPMVKDVPGYVFQALFLRKTTFETVGYLNEALQTAEDTDWIVRAEDMGMKREIINQVLVYRRLHATNISYQTGTQEGYKYRETLIMERIARRRKAQHNEN